MENIQNESHEKQFSYKEIAAGRVEDVIKNDHHDIEGKLAALINEDGLSVNDRRNLYNEIKSEVLHHMMAEERTYYPAIARTEGVKMGQVRESEQEHHQIRVLLDELDDVAVEDPTWCAKLRVLCEDVKHHHREEEEEFLSQTKEAWSDKESEEIGSDFLKSKKQANL